MKNLNDLSIDIQYKIKEYIDDNIDTINVLALIGFICFDGWACLVFLALWCYTAERSIEKNG